MTLRDFGEILRRSWLLIVAMTLCGAFAGLGLSLLATPVYKAQSQLFVSVQTDGEISGAYTGGLYLQQRIESYVTLVDTPGVIEPVIAGLALDTGVGDMTGQLTAQNPVGTVLINVLATDVDAQRAAKIADAAAASLAAKIEGLETTESGAKPVKAQLIRPAEVPSAPASPRTGPNIMLGAVLGLMLGVGIAGLRSKLDTTIRTADDLRGATHTALLASIAYDHKVSKKPLVTLDGAPLAESYRRLRTNLQYLDVDHPPRTVVITSSVPLEGKSTTAANLAIALAQGGAEVLLVEADLRRPRVAEYLGVEGSTGLTDVLIGQAHLDAAIVPWQRGLLDFLPSGAIPPNPSELLASQQLADLLALLSTRYDMVILDAPPLLNVTDAAILASAADGAILISRCGATKSEQAEQAADSLRQVNARLFGTVLNCVPQRRSAAGYSYGNNGGRKGAEDSAVAHTPDDALRPSPSNSIAARLSGVPSLGGKRAPRPEESQEVHS